MDNKMQEFIIKLKEKTINKNIRWNESSFKTGLFRFKFESGIVELSNYYNQNEETSYENIKIINNEGRVVYSSGIYSFDDVENITKEEYKLISDLYNSAYKQIYNKEEVINGILEELNTKKYFKQQSLLKFDTAEEDEEELPF